MRSQAQGYLDLPISFFSQAAARFSNFTELASCCDTSRTLSSEHMPQCSRRVGLGAGENSPTGSWPLRAQLRAFSMDCGRPRTAGASRNESTPTLRSCTPSSEAGSNAAATSAHKQQNGCASGRMPCPLLIQLGLMCGTRWAPPALQLQCGSTDTLVAPDLDWLPQWTRTAHLLSTGGTVHASGHRIQLETSPIFIISGSLLM